MQADSQASGLTNGLHLDCISHAEPTQKIHIVFLHGLKFLLLAQKSKTNTRLVSDQIPRILSFLSFQRGNGQ